MPGTLAFGAEPSSRRYRLRLARYQALTEAVRDYLTQLGRDHGNPLRLLDVGLGHGRTMRYLDAAGLSQGIDFYGVDRNPQRLARLYGAARWNVQQIDAQQGLPFGDAWFDVVVCEQVLEHLRDPLGVLREIARVARPGALVVLGVPSFPPGLAALRRGIVPRMDRLLGTTRGHAQVFTANSFVELVGSAGCFEVKAVRGFRVVSGGPLAPLEDFRWWYTFSRWLATRWPALAVEVQVLARRSAPAVLPTAWYACAENLVRFVADLGSATAAW